MKKFTIAIACLAVLSLASCKKELTCTCTTTDTSANGVATTDQPNVTKYKKIKKANAREKCISYSSENTNSSTFNGTTVSETTKTDVKCELK